MPKLHAKLLLHKTHFHYAAAWRYSTVNQGLLERAEYMRTHAQLWQLGERDVCSVINCSYPIYCQPYMVCI